MEWLKAVAATVAQKADAGSHATRAFTNRTVRVTLSMLTDRSEPQLRVMRRAREWAPVLTISPAGLTSRHCKLIQPQKMVTFAFLVAKQPS